METKKKEQILFYENMTKFAMTYVYLLLADIVAFFFLLFLCLNSLEKITFVYKISFIALFCICLMMIFPTLFHETIITKEKLILKSYYDQKEFPLAEIEEVYDADYCYSRTLEPRLLYIRVYFCHQGKKHVVFTKNRDLAKILFSYGKIRYRKG